jgi:NADH:ubiquinone oxidoreductase subunit F (NADH-binding)
MSLHTYDAYGTRAKPPTGPGRLLSAATESRREHEANLGPLPRLSAADLRARVEAAGLTGRGGAGFPTHRKWAAVAAGHDTVVVGNAAEGEPASGKDRWLLTAAPHLVLDGLVLAARAVGAAETHLYLPEDTHTAVRRALAERDDPVPVTVHVAPDAFVAGEESAVVSAINGGLPIPQDKLRRVLEHGVGGRPTLVQNVETLAHVALIARFGPAWFREQGTPDEPGTFLATITGAVVGPGVCEAAYGTPLGDVLAAVGGPAAPLRAVLVGGYHGAWIPADARIPISRAGLAPYGATPGAGIMVALAGDECGLAVTADILDYLAGQSAGQCGPCINGLPAIAGTFRALTGSRPRHGFEAELERLSAIVAGRGACKHPDGTIRLARSALYAFRDEIAHHRDGYCGADTKRRTR